VRDCFNAATPRVLSLPPIELDDSEVAATKYNGAEASSAAFVGVNVDCLLEKNLFLKIDEEPDAEEGIEEDIADEEDDDDDDDEEPARSGCCNWELEPVSGRSRELDDPDKIEKEEAVNAEEGVDVVAAMAMAEDETGRNEDEEGNEEEGKEEDEDEEEDDKEEEEVEEEDDDDEANAEDADEDDEFETEAAPAAPADAGEREDGEV
jgi:hypothetical protein